MHLDKVYRNVDADELNLFFNDAYEQYVSLMYPDQAAPPAHIVTQLQWTTLLRAIFKSRVDHVYSRATGTRPLNRVPLAASIPLPKIMADILNSYGVISVLEHSTIIIPTPGALGQNAVAPAIVLADERLFSSFVSALSHRGFCTLSTLTSDHLGSAAYTMAALDNPIPRPAPANPVANFAILATRTIHVYSWHSSFNPSDVLLCALMCNGYSHNLLLSVHWPFYADPIVDVPGIRTMLYSHF